MSLIKLIISISFLLFSSNLYSKEDVINLQLKDGIVKIKTFEDKAPKHVKQITDLVAKGSYDGVVFHRVIDGFMAQTGDVQFGNSNSDTYDLRRNLNVMLVTVDTKPLFHLLYLHISWVLIISKDTLHLIGVCGVQTNLHLWLNLEY